MTPETCAEIPHILKIMVDEVNYKDLEGANNLATYEIR